MKIKFAFYEHTCIGFPGVVLKWSEENGEWGIAYVTIKGIIQESAWQWREQYPTAFAKSEMDRFDEWVRNMFSNDISVQG